MAIDQNGNYSPYFSQAARDAERTYDKSYAETIERSSLEHCAYATIKGDHETAKLMLTQSLSEALQGNDGD